MKPLEWKDGKLRFLDQTKLPFEEYFFETDDVEVVAGAIRSLAVRGAPLIGITAAYGVALASLRLNNYSAVDIRSNLSSAIDLLASTRPTAVNLFWALERQRRILNAWKTGSISNLQKDLIDEARRIHQEDGEMCERISVLGVELLPDSCSILTHCNTGMLATGGRGTALGIITKAWELKKLKCVYIDETRPLLQGARLTMWELKQDNIPATLIADSTSAFLMNQRRIDVVIVGADRIAMNGDIANKVGTYNIAVLAKFHAIPFYVAAPVSTIDFQMKTGKEIPIEERSGQEVAEIFGKRITTENAHIYSPAFDLTPNELITAIITDRGILHPPFSDSIKSLHSNKYSSVPK
jgi:methylthioribose-1-phosphate isomerase